MIAEGMQLSDDEGSTFWPIYYEYEEKLYKINTEYFDIVKEFAENYESMSADIATDILIKANKVGSGKAELEKAYIKKYPKSSHLRKRLGIFRLQTK